MTPVPWPTGLNSILEQDSFSYETGETSIRSNMDVGPAKVRRRFTKSVDVLSGVLRISFSEFSVFDHFYQTTLSGGSRPFLVAHPITGEVKTFRFTKAPSYRPLGGGYWSVSMNWEKLP